MFCIVEFTQEIVYAFENIDVLGSGCHDCFFNNSFICKILLYTGVNIYIYIFVVFRLGQSS